MKGTFRKRGSTWYYQVELGRDPETGKRVQKSKGGFKTKKEAEAACADIISKFEKGEYHVPKRMTVEQFLNLWLRDYAKRKMRASSYSIRELLVQKRIVPAIGNIELEKLNPVDINKFYGKLQDENLSSSYIHSIHSLLRSALKKAIQWQITNRNIMSGVEPPRLEKTKIQTWTIEDIQTFLDASRENVCHIGFVLAAFTGMRRGEVLGLRWGDVDLENKKLTVAQSVYWIPGEGVIFQEPKTENSVRQIALSENVVKELKKRKAEQAQHKLLLGPGYKDHDLVCCWEDGSPIKPRNFLEHFERMIKAADVPKIRFHDIRHTHATLLLKMGENIKVVSERLGHSRTSTTSDIYTHVLPDMQQGAADRFESAFEGKKNTL